MPVQIPVTRLSEHCNPFRDNPWDYGSRLTKGKVSDAISNGKLAVCGTGTHAQRVAFLVVNPADDPIEIDVGVPVLGYNPDWMVLDGNHRLAAAIYANREFIAATVTGQMDYAMELFGVDYQEFESMEVD